MREEVREWLIDARAGIIDAGEVVARADRAIGELDNPPDYLIAVSLGEPLVDVARLDLVKYPLTPADLGGLASRLLARLESGSTSLEEIAAVAPRIGYSNEAASDEVWRHFLWIDDELDLIDQGVKDASNFRDAVVAALQQAAKHAAR